MNDSDTRTHLARRGQAHALAMLDQLDPAGRRALLDQLRGLDFALLDEMRRTLGEPAAAALGAAVEPARAERLAGTDLAAARARGEAALRDSRVGVILVAGGQGTRLGHPGPKGTYSIGPLSGASLFEIHARKIAAMERRYAAAIPFYVMTNEDNDATTRAHFEAGHWFGLSPERVRFFTQGMLPALFPDGRLVMKDPATLFMAPDGHGGTLAALRRTGMLDDMARRGADTLFYFQVDNPLVEIADPVFIGFHLARQSRMSIKVCAKRDPDEGLGLLCTREGRLMVVEYTEFTDEQKRERTSSGELRFLHGSVAIHAFSLPFLLDTARVGLPLHMAFKKVPYWSEAGCAVSPKEPNAFKFEKFIFDALPLAQPSAALEFERREEFSPLKNASGPDSPETVRRDMMEKFARWLDACGVAVPRLPSGELRYRIEIDPLFADGPEELRSRLPAGFSIQGDVLLR